MMVLRVMQAHVRTDDAIDPKERAGWLIECTVGEQHEGHRVVHHAVAPALTTVAARVLAC
jgi:hypothetical protein